MSSPPPPNNTLEWAQAQAKRQAQMQKQTQALGTSTLRRNASNSSSPRQSPVLKSSSSGQFQKEYVSFPALSDSGSEPSNKDEQGTSSPPKSRSPSPPGQESQDSRPRQLMKSFGNLFQRKVRRDERPKSDIYPRERLYSLMDMPRRGSDMGRAEGPRGEDERRTVSDPQRPMSRNSIQLTRETATAVPTSPVRQKTKERTVDYLRRHL
jgi:hypothetical protein